MLNIMRHWKAILGVLLIAAVLAEYLAWLFSCDPPAASENGQYGPYYGDCSRYRSVIIIAGVPVLSGLWHFIDGHHDIFLVIATAVIAWFTVTLSHATAGLEKLGAKQARDMRTSLRISLRAANAAKDAAAAADRTVATMEANAHRQLRAYPGITEADIWFEEGHVAVGLKVRNFSPTPAYKFRYAIVVYYDDRGKTAGPKWPIRQESIWDMAPGSTTTMKCSLSIEDNEKWQRAVKDRAIFISGCARYRDAFEHWHWIKFRYRTIPFHNVQGNRFRCTEPEAIFYDSN